MTDEDRRNMLIVLQARDIEKALANELNSIALVEPLQEEAVDLARKNTNLIFSLVFLEKTSNGPWVYKIQKSKKLSQIKKFLHAIWRAICDYKD